MGNLILELEFLLSTPHAAVRYSSRKNNTAYRNRNRVLRSHYIWDIQSQCLAVRLIAQVSVVVLLVSFFRALSAGGSLFLTQLRLVHVRAFLSGVIANIILLYNIQISSEIIDN